MGEDHKKHLSLLDIILSGLRKSTASSCRIDNGVDQEVVSAVMEIGWPTNVQHITHVTFDRFHGFLGLPVEFEVQIPSAASVNVYGVSADSMQWSYDTRCNSVPTILLLMQEKLYALGGLKAEGIFRINPENSQEEHVRDQLNRGTVPDEIDVHCLAGLIKAWFRELPSGVLDGLSTQEILQCDTEEEFAELIKQLKPIESCLLSWAIDLMADVVEYKESNKMNARNIAMVFAPNMTKMSDPLTALMHAVQVMNLLKTLIMKRLREREDACGGYPPLSPCFSDRLKNEGYDGRFGMGIRCESTSETSDDEELVKYSPSSEDKYECDSLSDVEDCFSRQLDENENAIDGFRKQLERILCRDHMSPSHGSTFNTDSCVSFSDSRVGSSFISTSDDDDPRLNSYAFTTQEGCKKNTRFYH